MAKLSVEEFLGGADPQGVPILDVRSPGEYEQGHLPGAHNLPLFSDEERAEIGTLYKQRSREAAFDRGLELVGPKLVNLVRQARSWAVGSRLRVHCWRGGMRSASMGQLLQSAGFEVDTLEGGYKAYRRKVLSDLAHPLPLMILGGKTGSGKTDLLHELVLAGEQVIDLEGLAHHKGSAFGALGQPKQPSSEHFANKLHQALSQLDPERPIWVEDESHNIGRVHLPEPFWEQMKAAPVLAVEVPTEWRVQRLVADYGQADPDHLATSLHRIQKRLGGQNHQRAMTALQAHDMATVARICLTYYDKAYQHALEQKNSEKVRTLILNHPDLSAQAQQLIQALNHHFHPKT